MTPTFVNPADLVPPRGYNHGVLMPIGPGAQLLCVAGQIGWDREGRLVSHTFPEQFERALANVVAVVTDAGGQPSSIIKLTIYVTDKTLYEASLGAVGDGYRRVMAKHFPAMVLVEINGLLEARALVEIDATAVIATN